MHLSLTDHLLFVLIIAQYRSDRETGRALSYVLGGSTPIMRLSTVSDQVRKWIPKRRDKSAILMKMRKRISKICNSQTVDLDLQFSRRGGGGDGAPWFCTLTNQILVPTVFASHLCLFVFVNLSLSLSRQLSVSPLCLQE